MNYKTSLTKISLVFLMMISSSFAITVELEGSPEGGAGVVDAPIFTLNGRALSSISVGNVNGDQDLTFSMDNVNTGNVYTTGSMHLTAEDWDAWFEVDSTYVISSYGELILVSFNHKLKKDSEQECLIRGNVAMTGEISSEGSMVLVREDFTFDGMMRGTIKAWADKKKKIAIVNQVYPALDDEGDRIVIENGKRYETFTQSFTDIVVADQGVWSAAYNVNEVIKKGRSTGVLTGTGTIVVGPQDAPVDTVAQKVGGKKNATTGIYSWTTTSIDRKKDKNVKVTIKHTASELVDDVLNPNSVSAAAQTRNF